VTQEDRQSFTRCTALTATGDRCPKAVQAGKAACWTHTLTPEQRREAGKAAMERAAQKKAQGPAGGLPADLADALEQATEPAQVRDVLARVGAAVLRGQLAPTTGKIISTLAGQVLRAMSDDLADDIAEVRAALANHESETVRTWATRKRKR
jgi:hypothetical protein